MGSPRSLSRVYRHFVGICYRRSGFITALTAGIRISSSLSRFGFSLFFLISSGFSLFRWILSGFPLIRLISSGFSLFCLISSGFSLFRWISSGFSSFRLISSGFSSFRLISSGFSLFRLISSGFLFSWSQMRRNLWPFVILKDCLLCVDSDGVAWEVTFPPSPSDVPPPDHPEPAPGVNCKLDDTVPLRDWLLQIALQCDSWLQSVVSHLAAQFDIADRDCLLTLANTLSPVYQAVALSMGIGLDGENESKIPDETTREGVRIHKQCGSSLGEKENETAAQDQGIVLDGGNESKIPVETTGNGVGVHKECGSSSDKDNEF
ncbi:hypothetical protein Scep_014927 [Stephania cephalantha]|uniref:PHD finger protein ALFIN-LIKE n=1 Tax=Stephania cephalantha TaxID=152367 RepID=A0AAP0J235_9MAGN